MSTVSGSGSSDTPNPPTLQDRIETVLREHQWSFIKHGCRCEDPGTVGEWPAHAADAVTQLLIDMAGHSELLASIDRMYR